MELGNQILQIIDTLKQKNQMSVSQDKEYLEFKFQTQIDGLNYTVSKFQEIAPHWKDSGTKGDFLHAVTVLDNENNTVAKISSTYGGSYILEPQNTTLINLEKLKSITDNLEVLPKENIEKQTSTIVSNIKTMRENTLNNFTPNSLKFDWK